MAQRAARRCAKCGEIVRGRCETCSKAAAKRYDDFRGNRHERGYDNDWEKVAKLARQRDGYLCVHCEAKGTLTPAKTVDHITPIHVAPERRLDLSNTQTLCETCHARKTQEDVRRWGSASVPK